MVDGSTPLDASELLGRIARGDRDAFTAFARRFERPLYRFLAGLTGSAAAAEDARQITLLRVFRKAATYRGGSVAVWVFRIAHRVALDLRRRDRRRTSAGDAAEVGLADRSPSPQRRVERAEQNGLVQDALARLHPDDRTIVWLRVAEELSFAQVAAVTAEAPSTVRYRFLRALQQLRRQLGTPVDCGLDA